MDNKDKFLKLTSGVVLLGSAPSLVSMAEGNEGNDLKEVLKYIFSAIGVITVIPYILLLFKRDRRKVEIENQLKANNKDLGEKREALNLRIALLEENRKALEENDTQLGNLNGKLSEAQGNLSVKENSLAYLEKQLEQTKKNLEEKEKALEDLKKRSEQAQKDSKVTEENLELLNSQSEQVEKNLKEKKEYLACLQSEYEKEKSGAGRIESLVSEIKKEITEIEEKMKVTKGKIKDIEKKAKVLDKDLDLKDLEIETETEKLTQLENDKNSIEQTVKDMEKFIECYDFCFAGDNLKVEKSNIKFYNKELKKRFDQFKIKVEDGDYEDEEKLSVKLGELVEKYNEQCKNMEEHTFKYLRIITNKIKSLKVIEKSDDKDIINLRRLKKCLDNFFRWTGNKYEKVKEEYLELKRLCDDFYNNFGNDEEAEFNDSIKKNYEKIKEYASKIDKEIHDCVDKFYNISDYHGVTLRNVLEIRKETKEEISKAEKCINSFKEKYDAQYTPEDMKKILSGLMRNFDSWVTVDDVGCKFEKVKEIDSKFSDEKGYVSFEYDAAIDKIKMYCSNFNIAHRYCRDFLEHYKVNKEKFLGEKIMDQEKKLETLSNEREEIRQKLQDTRYQLSMEYIRKAGGEVRKKIDGEWIENLGYSESNRSEIVLKKEEQMQELYKEQEDLKSKLKQNLEDKIKLESKMNDLLKKQDELQLDIEKEEKSQKELKIKEGELSEEYKTLELEKENTLDQQERLSKEIEMLSINREQLVSKKENILKDKEKLERDINELSAYIEKLGSEKDTIEHDISVLKEDLAKLSSNNANLDKEKNDIKNNFYSLDFFKSFGQDETQTSGK